MQERKREPKRKTQKDFIKSKSPRMGTVYDTVAFNNYQAERINRLRVQAQQVCLIIKVLEQWFLQIDLNLQWGSNNN